MWEVGSIHTKEYVGVFKIYAINRRTERNYKNLLFDDGKHR